MSAPALTVVPGDSRRATWARVDSGLYVASREGEFVGYVDTAPGGSYIAFDGHSTPVGRYDDLRAAQRAVTSVTNTREITSQRKTLQALHAVAAVSGTVAGVMVLAAGTMAPYL
ncbi:peptide ABC transporter permease [Microbacterium fluvii]|uniref:Peptide ABC transporter permease n=1 Tax=Microbacterium fluvii TaxID=415215 RepID=A0ABW2HI00_9MICO|nr:peptide ABC transporter permease [Microbacterium fluvii]MCU4672988.1 peptide ABC transporter permease [Microbacterium fluvii]